MNSDFSASYSDEEPIDHDDSIVERGSEDIYFVPRRFDLVAMMVVMSGYALMFAIFRFFGAGDLVFIYFAGLTSSIGIAQMLTETQFSPRAVSIFIGIAFFYLWIIGLSAFGMQRNAGAFAFVGVFWGPLQGYLGGTLVAGHFLVADYLRRALSLIGSKRQSAIQEAEQSPWDETPDAD